MSTLTKILIVVMAVCSVVISVVMIQYVNNTPNWKAGYEDERNARLAADAGHRAALGENEQLKIQLDLAGEINKQSLADRDGKIEELSKQNGTLGRSNAELTTDKVNLQATNANMSNMLQQQMARNEQLTRQLEERQTLVLSQNNQLQDNDNKIKELTRDLDHATEAAQKNREVAAAMESRVKELEDKIRRAGITTASETAARPAATEKIEGRVLDVLKDKNIASLTIGSASGVTPGMDFILYRGDQLVGRLSVAKVDATTCAGTLSDLLMSPQRGDIATTRLMTK